jgi:phytoene dehydrogenase-like protein
MFEKPLQEQWANAMRKNTKPALNTFICLGVETDLSDLPESFSFIPDEPLLCGGMEVSVIGINNYASYEGYAPRGCTAVTSIIAGDSYDYWKQCQEKGSYEIEKQKVAEAFIKIVENKYPKVKGKITVWDVATPLTYERYLGSYKGSWMSIMEKGDKMQSYPSKPESVEHVYFAGQRVAPPGGLPVAVETGRKAVQYLCKDTDTVFQGNI